MKEKNKIQICREIKALNHCIRRHIQHHLKENGPPELTLMHSWILAYLNNNADKPVYQRDIEKEFNIGRSSVTGMLNLMESKGYIKRKQSEYDARLKQLIVTPKAVELLAIIEKDKLFMEETITRNISKDDIDNFYRIINIMKSNIQNLSKDNE